MKKLFSTILVLGLLWCNVSLAVTPAYERPERAYYKHIDTGKLFNAYENGIFKAKKKALQNCKNSPEGINNPEGCKYIQPKDINKEIKIYDAWKYSKNKKKKIAKKEPSQTDEVWDGVYRWNNIIVSQGTFCEKAKSSGMPTFNPEEYKLKCLSGTNQTQIAKKEPTIKPEDKTKKQTTVTSETNSSDNKYRELVKKFGSECESSWSNFFTGYKVGTPEFDQCLVEKQNEQIKLARFEAEKLKTEKEIFMTLTVEEKRAYTCANTFGFKKGSDKFKDCVFKIYAAELELEKLEVEKQLAEAQLETAKAHREAAEARVLAAKAQGELQKAQIQATEAQAAASRQQAAASKAQTAATKQQSSMSLLMQGLQMLQPAQTQSSFKTSCRWSGGFFNCW